MIMAMLFVVVIVVVGDCVIHVFVDTVAVVVMNGSCTRSIIAVITTGRPAVVFTVDVAAVGVVTMVVVLVGGVEQEE